MFVISGKKRSGKDTVASMMKEHGYKTYALADPIKSALHHGFVQIMGPEFVTLGMLYAENGYDREQPLNMTVNEVRQVLIESVFYTFNDAEYSMVKQSEYYDVIVDKLLKLEDVSDFSVRKFMTYFGTDIICYEVSDKHWLNICELKAPSDAVITDVRQPWEEEYFREKDAKFIFVIGAYPEYVEPEVNHITEQGLTPRSNDVILINKDISELKKEVECLLKLS